MSGLHWLLVYLLGSCIVGAWAWRDIRKEPTAHGQAVLAPIGCMMTLFWPFLPALGAFILLFAVLLWFFGKPGE